MCCTFANTSVTFHLHGWSYGWLYYVEGYLMLMHRLITLLVFSLFCLLMSLLSNSLRTIKSRRRRYLQISDVEGLRQLRKLHEITCAAVERVHESFEGILLILVVCIFFIVVDCVLELIVLDKKNVIFYLKFSFFLASAVVQLLLAGYVSDQVGHEVQSFSMTSNSQLN